jgi:two-component system phosphate regulon response regulator PhoB
MSGEHILIVEDEEDIISLVEYNLLKCNFQVSSVTNGEEAIAFVRKTPPALILLDLMLPGLSGYDVCKSLRQDERTRLIPIIMLTAKSEETDMVQGLEMGADDYIPKPFSPKILMARVSAVLRRTVPASHPEHATFKINEMEIHPGKHQVFIKGDPVNLTYTEFQILHFLSQRPGWVFTRSQIIDAVRGEDYPVTDRSVDVQIVSLRKKMGDYGDLIETVRSVGYRFKD